MKSIGILLILAALCFLSAKATFGCAVITVPSLTRFNASEYVFIGKVVGVAGPIESTKFHGKAWGVKVQVTEEVYLPSKVTEYFEVFPFDLESDCRDKGWSSERLLRYFPLGSSVKVVAKESKYSPSKFVGGNIRLEILPDNLGSVSRNSREDGTTISSADSVFDYKTYLPDNPCGMTEDDYPAYEANLRTPDFELRKDLLRLNAAKNETQRVKILERLIYLPSPSDEFTQIAKHYLRGRATERRLNKSKEKWWRTYSTVHAMRC
jgi:hypothetical protein